MTGKHPRNHRPVMSVGFTITLLPQMSTNFDSGGRAAGGTWRGGLRGTRVDREPSLELVWARTSRTP